MMLEGRFNAHNLGERRRRRGRRRRRRDDTHGGGAHNDTDGFTNRNVYISNGKTRPHPAKRRAATVCDGQEPRGRRNIYEVLFSRDRTHIVQPFKKQESSKIVSFRIQCF
jgi:hypothetical protein